MSLPLTTSSDLAARKELVRLRMEMHRQQLLYNAQPLANPFDRVKGMLSGRRSKGHHSTSKGPMVIAATLALSLFGRRLGKLGILARLGLTLYPLLKAQALLVRKRH
ncbi:hypothetical protein [Stutzerimonas tarimensis]|uniref:Uncharacterized protein n=1 Tax=Stutzerimonas tarimensis TaxID=1507735 RepID=A0ABV7T2Z8_9GAMM